MDDPALIARIDALEKKIDAIYVSVEKTRNYFLVVLIGSVIVFVLPLLGLAFAIPSLMATYSSIGNL